MKIYLVRDNVDYEGFSILHASTLKIKAENFLIDKACRMKRTLNFDTMEAVSSGGSFWLDILELDVEE